MTRARAGLAAAAGALALAPAAAAGRSGPVVQIAVADAMVPGPPPLAPSQPIPAQRVLGRLRIASRSTVAVGTDARGRPRSVRVVQRLVLRGTGDYAFAIPAPVRNVSAAEGSESEPGARPGQILWRGFAPGRRVLAARATIDAAQAAPALPLRIRVSGAPRRAGAFALTVAVTDATATRVATYDGDARAADVAAALDALARTARRGGPPTPAGVRFAGPPAATTTAATAAFRVRIRVRFPAGSVRELRVSPGSGVAGDAEVRIRGRTDASAAGVGLTVSGVARRAATPAVEVVADPDPAAAVARAPGDAWSDAVRGRLTPGTGRRLLATLWRSRLGYVRSRQYEAFLANPDARGTNATTYVFRTARPATDARAAGRAADNRTLPGAVVAAALVLAAAALLVVWAHL